MKYFGIGVFEWFWEQQDACVDVVPPLRDRVLQSVAGGSAVPQAFTVDAGGKKYNEMT